MGASIDKRVDVLFSIAGGILFIATGAVIIDQWNVQSLRSSEKNVILAAGSTAIICGSIFITDIVVIVRSPSIVKY